MFFVGRWLLCALFVLLLLDAVLLYGKRGVLAWRTMSERFSNGDDNEVDIRVESQYPFPLNLQIIDEIPAVFQRRDVLFKLRLQKKEGKNVKYSLRPTSRGVYSFGYIRIFAQSPVGMMLRRFTMGEPKEVKVYPSYLMLTHYELLAINASLVLSYIAMRKDDKASIATFSDKFEDFVSPSARSGHMQQILEPYTGSRHSARNLITQLWSLISINASASVLCRQRTERLHCAPS